MLNQSFDDLIRHFRRKARHYTEMADAIEKEARELQEWDSKTPENRELSGTAVIKTASEGTLTVRSHRPRTIGLPGGEPTPENIRGYLSQKKARPRDLAMHFKVEEEVIRRIVSEPLNRIGVGDRGWLFCDEQQVFFKPEETKSS